jgi:copper transport protein
MPKLLCAAVVVIVVGLPATSFAHAAYKDSSPRDEETVAVPPESVWAEYTEPLQDGSHLEIYDPCGTQVDHDDTEITGYRMTISMTGERSGTYTARWVAASAIDPHVTRGAFTFIVTDGPACEEAAAAPEREAEGENSPSQQDSTSKAAESDAARDRSAEASDGGTKVKGRLLTKEKDTARSTNRRQIVAQERSDETQVEERSLWAGMPWDWFGIAMLLAAAIGAAGGRIYAGIMGPRR